MIAHQKQGYNECLLAAVAMATGQSLKNIRAWACSTFHVRYWYDLQTLPGDGFWEAAVQLLDHFVAPGFGAQYRAELIGVPGNSPNLEGRGILTIRNKANNTSHAVAFDAGMVHDGNCNQGMPFMEWWALLGAEWQILSITHVLGA